MNEFDIAKKLFRSGVGHRVTKEGIRVAVIAKPKIHKDIIISDEHIKAKVVEWLRNPGPCEPEQWDKIREPLWEITLTMLEFMFEHGDMPKGLLLTMIKTTLDKYERKAHKLLRDRNGS